MFPNVGRVCRWRAGPEGAQQPVSSIGFKEKNTGKTHVLLPPHVV